MKKNVRIGLGLALVSAISLAAALPVFADVKGNFIERTGTVAMADRAISIEEKATTNEPEETTVTENGSNKKEESVKTPDFENSPNFCRADYDPKELENPSPEVKPSDYKDPAIRNLAEEYKDKGYFLTDCKYEATKHGSGFGSPSYLFCNGFNAVDKNDGNNTVFIQAVKCTQAEFDWYLTQFSGGSLSSSEHGKIKQHIMENTYIVHKVSSKSWFYHIENLRHIFAYNVMVITRNIADRLQTDRGCLFSMHNNYKQL